MHFCFQFLALISYVAAAYLVRGSPIHTSSSTTVQMFDDANNSNEIPASEIIRISAIVNGVQANEIPAILTMIVEVREEIKHQAFSILKNEVARVAKTGKEIADIIDALSVRIILERSICVRIWYRQKIYRV